MSATAGKVALVTSQTALELRRRVRAGARGVRDFVGYGAANDFEGGGAAPAPSNTTAATCAPAAAAPTPTTTPPTSRPARPRRATRAAAATPCTPAGDAAPAVESSDPANGATEVDPAADLRVTFTEPVTAGDGAFALACDGADVALAVRRDGDAAYVLDPASTLPEGRSCTLHVDGAGYHDDDSTDPPDTGSDYAAGFTTRAVAGLRIHDVQGRQHVSPYNGALVAAVPGVVTARRTNGFFFQDPQPDADDRTSEGVFVFTSSAPAAALQPGTAVTVSGTVSEFRSGGSAGFANLSTTELTRPTTTVTGTGTIAPTLIGRGGRVAPTEIIDNDTVDPGGEDPPTTGGNVEAKSRPAPAEQDPTFDPEQDGIDFYESLEGMLTEVARRRRPSARRATSAPTASFRCCLTAGPGRACWPPAARW